MRELELWTLIERTRARRVAEHARRLGEALETLPTDELPSFEAIVNGYFWALDRRDLWAAADAIRAGCPDEAWGWFRQWLILQGPDVITGAVHDPDSLADVNIDEDPRCETLISLGRTIYRARGGGDMPRPPKHVVDTQAWPPDRIADYSWTDADTERLYPRLTAMAAWRHFARC